MNAYFGTITRAVLNSWTFPMFIGRRWDERRFEPFIGVGGAFRRIDGYDFSTETFAAGFNPRISIEADILKKL